MERHYRLQVATGEDAALVAALRTLSEALRPIDGFEAAVLLRESEAQGTYLFSERWSSPAASRAGAASLPKTAFAALMRTLAAPPTGTNYDPVSLQPDA